MSLAELLAAMKQIRSGLEAINVRKGKHGQVFFASRVLMSRKGSQSWPQVVPCAGD
jgi:hypothetical protein